MIAMPGNVLELCPVYAPALGFIGAAFSLTVWSAAQGAPYLEGDERALTSEGEVAQLFSTFPGTAMQLLLQDAPSQGPEAT